MNAAKAQASLLANIALLQDLLDGLKSTNLEEDLVSYAKFVSQAETILIDAEGGIETELQIWESIQLELEKYKNDLMKQLDDCWLLNVCWESTADRLSLKLGPTDQLQNIFRALLSMNQLDRLLSDFSSRLLEDLLMPVLKADSTICVQDVVQITDGRLPISDMNSLRPVLSKLSTLFDYLKGHLDFQVDKDRRALDMIGQQIGDDFSKHFVKQCLKTTLPHSSSMLASDEYVQHLEQVKRFEMKLRQVGLLAADGDGDAASAISEFVANVDVFFADKECLESMTKARQLMTQDLHDTRQLKDHEADQTVTQDVGETAHLWKMLSEGGMEMKWSPFVFPQCHVSRSTQELIELVGSLVSEACLSEASKVIGNVKNL